MLVAENALSSTLTGRLRLEHTLPSTCQVRHILLSLLLSISSTTEDNSSFPSIFTGVMPTKPGSCGLPYYGIEFAVLEPVVSILNLRHVHYASA